MIDADQEFDVNKFFEDIMSRFIDFGMYAKILQKSIYVDKKTTEYENHRPIESALTDADIMIQEGILRVILELGYNVSILAEENSPYLDKFQPNEKVVVAIDPIDGTLNYSHGNSKWCSIITVYVGGVIEGTMINLPSLGKVFCATNEKGWIIEYDKQGNITNQIQDLQPATAKLIGTNYQDGKLVEFWQNKGFQVNESDKATTSNKGPECLLRGEMVGYFSPGHSSIDWTPFALIVEKFGGFVSDYLGNKDEVYKFHGPTRRFNSDELPGIIISWDKELHQELLESVRNLVVDKKND